MGLLISCTIVKIVKKDVGTKEFSARPVPSDQVRIVEHKERMGQCRRVASLRAEGEQPFEKIIKKLRKEAGRLGANTLLVLETKRTAAEHVTEGV